MAFSKLSSFKFSTQQKSRFNYIHVRKNFGVPPKKRFFSTETEGAPKIVAETPTSPLTTAPAEAKVDKKLIVETPKETLASSNTKSSGSGGGSGGSSSAENEKLSKVLTIKDVKNNIRGKPPKFMNLWYILGLAGIGAATMYYLNEQDRHERKVEHAVKMIESKDLDVKREGVQQLDHCLFLQKKLLSTVTEIPMPKKILVDSGLVEALMNCYSEDDITLKEAVTIWLYRLSEIPEGRKRIASFGIEPILFTMAATDTKAPLWLSLASILLNLASHDDSIPGISTVQFRNTVNAMYSSDHPLAPLVAAHIEQHVLQNDQGKHLFEGARLKSELAALTNTQSTAALKAAIRAVIPPEPKPHNPPDALLNRDTIINLNTLWSPLAWGVLGSVYGSIRWSLAGRLGGLRGQDLKKFVKKQNKTGNYIFFLLMLDPLAQLMMAWPEKGIKLPYVDEPVKLPKEPLGLPLTTAIPIAESALFVGAGLFALRYQRFVLAPMMAAMATAHREEIQEFSKPAQEILGIQEDPLKVLERNVRSKVQQLIDEAMK